MGGIYTTQRQPFQKIQEQMDFVDEVLDSIADDLDTLKVDLDTFKDTINQLIMESIEGVNVEEVARFVADDSLQSQIKALGLRIHDLESLSPPNRRN